MNRLLILIICFVFALPSLSQDTITESIPNSELYVSFPSNWNFIRPYLGNGKYSSIQLNLPKGEYGGYPMFPQFEFEFLSLESKDKGLEELLNSDLSAIKINGIESKLFTYKPEFRYLFEDMSHAYATLQVTGYLVPISNGHLICKLTTSSEEGEHTKYISILETYCSSVVQSVKSPSK